MYSHVQAVWRCEVGQWKCRRAVNGWKYECMRTRRIAAAHCRVVMLVVASQTGSACETRK